MQISVEDLMAQQEHKIIIDVRTNTEFLEGSVFGSINIPIFDEEERESIGKIYKKNPKAARFVALDILGPKLPKFIRKINSMVYLKSKNKTPVILCWRGGMRSQATVELLKMVGIQALQLAGGYRSYRQYIYKSLNDIKLTQKILVLKGKSGTGKTEVLRTLESQGLPVLDLEGLARHRGSAFGGYLNTPPVSQKDFDSRLFSRLRQLQGSSTILVEGESKRIGNIYLPDFLYTAMQQAPVIETTAPLERRVQRILEDYTPSTELGKLKVYNAVSRLKHKLSAQDIQVMQKSLDQEEYAKFVELVLTKHYDNIYDYQLPSKEIIAKVDTRDIEKAANEIAALWSHF